MTRSDLIEQLAASKNLNKVTAESIIQEIFGGMADALIAGNRIEIRGFGSFRTRQRKPRVGRNPKTGDRVDVPAKKIPFFKPSKELKDVVNNAPDSAPAPTGAEAAS